MIDALTPKEITLTSSVSQDEITEKIGAMFDYDFDGVSTKTVALPSFPEHFQIGLIIGGSGSGKSTILKEVWGGEKPVTWDNNKSIASNFSSFEEASELFGAVGLNSIPTWCKPYSVLSNGEKFRADMARRLNSNAVIDEFTSVVNREVAKSCSFSIAKYIRNNGLENVVFASCHDDIIPFLEPDWVYSTDEHEFYSGRYLRQPIILETRSCDYSLWNMFKEYHYLSGDLNKASNCYLCMWGDRPVAFIAVLSLPNAVKHAFKEHRLVVHPDFQGMGIGNRLSEMIAQAYIEKGCRYFCKTANPRMGEHRDRSKLWRPTTHNHQARHDYLLKDGTRKKSVYAKDKDYRLLNDKTVLKHSQRVCYAHEYVGDGTVYPYTFKRVVGKQIDGQLKLF